MKALAIARKTLLELWREPLLLGLMLFFPVVFVGFYYIAFGRTDEGLATYLSLLVVNDDAGAAHWQAGTELVEAMRGLEWEGEPIFELAIVNDRRTAETALREHKAALLLDIPPHFTQALVEASAGGEEAPPATISLVGDPGSDNYIFARNFLDGLVRSFTKQIVGWQDDTLTIAYEFLPGTGTMSDFDFGVGGLIVFGIMFAVLTTATVMVRENVVGTLRRLRLTRANARDLLLGVTLAQMIVVTIQILITFGGAVAMGFRSHGSLLLAIVIGLLLSLTAIGLGLIVACFARNDGEAVNLASGVLVPAIFLSDAMYPMPDVPIATVAGRTIQVYDFSPATHAADAMRRVLSLGDGLAAIWYELTMLTLLSLILLAVGVVLYQRLKLRRA